MTLFSTNGARCIASALNRGREAARAASAMLNMLEENNELHSMNRRVANVDKLGSFYH